MIQIYRHSLPNNKFEIIIQNELGQEFKIHFGGADLYWSMADYVPNNRFTVTKEDLLYNQLDNIFTIALENDKNHKLITENCLEWKSEAYGQEDSAHRLLITKNQNDYFIEFIRNPEDFSPENTCYISFCLNGSSNQTIASAFSKMFLEYKNYDIDKLKIKSLKP